MVFDLYDVRGLIKESKSGVALSYLEYKEKKIKWVLLVTDSVKTPVIVRYKFERNQLTPLKSYPLEVLPEKMFEVAKKYNRIEKEEAATRKWNKQEKKLFKTLLFDLERKVEQGKIKKERVEPGGYVTPYDEYSTLDGKIKANKQFGMRPGSAAVAILGIRHDVPEIPEHLQYLFKGELY